MHDWLQYLEAQHYKSIDLGLERISQVAATLDVLRPAPLVITVAGTNGKGSTVRILEQILLAAGYQAGSYTSPHFLHYNERVRVAGAELSDKQHCDAFAVVEAARGDASLTYFEYGTLAALQLLKAAKLDVVILEVGLGGRLDAVNIVDPDIAIVTSVGIDHVAFLGDDREQIGFEKAGIYRPGKPAICADPEPPQRLLQHATDIKASLYCLNRDYHYELTGSGWDFASSQLALKQLPIPVLPLPSAAAALACLGFLAQPPERGAIELGLSTAQLPGRMQVLSGLPMRILDVAHNPHAAEYLARQLQQRWPGRAIRAVCGMLCDKDMKNTLAPLTPLVSNWYLATLPGPRGNTAAQLADELESKCKKSFESVAEAYQNALSDAEEGDIVLCFGSFLTIQAIYEVEG
ncbi:bifunctional tetrahydrofolate synthase/dihydrofolate synthase [Aliidiomarina minuta]|uniref:Dihydrofolate synthase/folylpolyglutamate synthase n=1 Tax=Aliidiomarina minuta TaxID=880057 RepID=A0A432WAJ3_9GAMM|nr:bifunctional tetrahydrofolate synthase/dihydrofolate synthase [Aliidiomarina minuta]